MMVCKDAGTRPCGNDAWRSLPLGPLLQLCHHVGARVRTSGRCQYLESVTNISPESRSKVMRSAPKPAGGAGRQGDASGRRRVRRAALLNPEAGHAAELCSRPSPSRCQPSGSSPLPRT